MLLEERDSWFTGCLLQAVIPWEWPQVHLAHPEDNDLNDQQAQRLWGLFIRRPALRQPACERSSPSNMLLLQYKLETHTADNVSFS